jgi:hypothetical protein
MLDPSDAVLVRRRRRFLLVNFLIAGSYAAGGVVIGWFAGDRVGYLMAVVFGVVVYWAVRLLQPLEVLLALPATHFVWIAPEYERTRSQLAAMRPAANTIPPIPEPAARSGVWDEELDGAPEQFAG